ncbi:MAG: serine hydrolase [Saprospiraceae bacterium]
MKNKFFLTICFSLLLNVSILNAQKLGILSREKANKIDRLLNLYNSFGEISGTVLVAQNGKIIYKKAFGLANREWDIPNTIDTKFRIGSITKQFTAAIILQLIEEKKLKLKDNISTHLPYYRDDTGNKVTIHHLLNHTSGIPNYSNRPDFITKIIRSYIPTVALVKEYCSDDLAFEPGEKFSYTNSGYVILGAIIESITRKTYEENLQERILIPLEMNDTGYDSHYNIMTKRAAGYQKVGFKIVNAMFIDMSVPNAAGGMYSTIEDLYRWERAIMGNKFLSKKLKKKMLKPEKGDYGYGWYIEDTPVNVNGTETLQVHHSGRIPGFSASIVSLVEDNHTIIILGNNDGTPNEEITEKIKLTLYDMPYDLPRKSIIPIMLQSIEKQGVEIAIEEYKNLKEAQKAIWTFRVNELDDLARELTKLGKKEEAKLIYELNIEEFPEEYLPYFSLGEYYKLEGKKKKAIQFYRLALEKNPDNKTIKSRLKGLGEKME